MMSLPGQVLASQELQQLPEIQNQNDRTEKQLKREPQPPLEWHPSQQNQCLLLSELGLPPLSLPRTPEYLNVQTQYKHKCEWKVSHSGEVGIVIRAYSQESDGYCYRYHYLSKGESHQVATNGSLIIWATLGGNYLWSELCFYKDTYYHGKSTYWWLWKRHMTQVKALVSPHPITFDIIWNHETML